MKKVLPGICIQSLITIFCLTISFEPVSAQEGYLRSLPSQDYQSIADMQVTATGEMHIAATSFLYRLNNAGEIALQKEIKEGSYSEIRAAIPTVDGGDAVLLHALENMTTERLVFFHLSADGNLSGRKVVSDIGSHDQVKMKKLGADHYLVTFKKWVTATSAVVWAIYLNASGDKIWETTVTERMFNVYNVVEVNDRIELQYRKKDHPGASLVRITAQGPIETVDFVFSNNVTESDYLTHFDRLADGSYVIAGLHSPNSLKYDDIVLIRTNANGEETAVKRIDIYQRELMHQVKVVADGILLLAASGHGSWGDSNRGDILIIKTDFDGNELWRKAFSSQSADIGYLLAVHSNSIYMTGRMNVIGGSTDTPVAMKLNNEGSLPDDFPFETASSDDLKDFNTGLNDDMQTLVAAIAGANNNVILGMNRLDKPNDRLLPAVLCTQMGGSVAWSLPFPLDAGELKVLSRIRQGDNLVITEKRDLFGNVYNITQFDENHQPYSYHLPCV